MKVNKRRRAKISQRTGSIVALCVALILTLCVGYLGSHGMWLDGRGLWRLLPWLPTGSVETWPQPNPLGADLKGGQYVEFVIAGQEEAPAEDILELEPVAETADAVAEGGSELPAEEPAQASADPALLQQQLDESLSIIRRRLQKRGYADVTVAQLNQTGIRVELPDADNAVDILSLVSSPGKLTFVDPEGNTFMDSSYLTKAEVVTYQSTGQPLVVLTLNKEGEAILGAMTAANIGSNLTILLDGATLMNATLDRVISNDLTISGSFTHEQAQDIAVLLANGILPVELTQTQQDTLTASLGVDALPSLMQAALIGLILVAALLLVRYRLSGLMACWSLCVLIILTFLVIGALPGLQMTLAAFAGLLLALLLAIDAQVILLEHVRREVREGHTLVLSARLGLQQGRRGVLEASFVAFLLALALLIVGTSPLKYLGGMLLLGVLVNLVTSLAFTRFLLNRLAQVVKNPGLFIAGTQNAETTEEGAK